MSRPLILKANPSTPSLICTSKIPLDTLGQTAMTFTSRGCPCSWTEPKLCTEARERVCKRAGLTDPFLPLLDPGGHWGGASHGMEGLRWGVGGFLGDEVGFQRNRVLPEG